MIVTGALAEAKDIYGSTGNSPEALVKSAFGGAVALSKLTREPRRLSKRRLRARAGNPQGCHQTGKDKESARVYPPSKILITLSTALQHCRLPVLDCTLTVTVIVVVAAARMAR